MLLLPLAVAGLGLSSSLAPAGAPAVELLPDLRIVPPAEVQLCGGVDPADSWRDQHCTPVGFGDQRLLRFESIVYNAGDGPLDIVASRPNKATAAMHGVQRIRRSNGSWSNYDGGALLEYALEQDGHPHWHTHGFETYRLFRLDAPLPDGAKVGHKIGYCFFDGRIVRPDLLGSQKAHYKFKDCGTQKSRKVKVGLSVGWGDSYPANFAGQYVDITDGVPDGDYLLCITADPLDQFRESNEDDNDAWARIELAGDGATVTAVGDTNCRQQLPYD